MLFPLLALILHGVPGPVGVFRSPDRLVQVALRGEDQLRVRQWGQATDGMAATFDPSRRELRTSMGDVLEFNEDYSAFTVRGVLPLFGRFRGAQPFTRLTPAELEQLVKATRGGEREAQAFLAAVHEAEVLHHAEFEAYSADLQALGVAAEACPDGTRAQTAEPGYLAGCRFVFAVELQRADYVAVAFGVAPEVKGRVFSISSGRRGRQAAGIVHGEKWLRGGGGAE